jgi:hypothetical protein
MRPYFAFTMCGATAHALPFLDRVVDRRHVLAGDAGVVDEDVDLAELREAGFHGRLHRIIARDVHFRGAVEVPYVHPGARGRQSLGDGRADAGDAARDDRGAALEIQLIHPFITP